MSKERMERSATPPASDNGVPRQLTIESPVPRMGRTTESSFGSAVQDVVDSLLAAQAQQKTDMDVIRDRLDNLVLQKEQHGRLSAMVADLHERYSKLSEDFYQRETLGPVFHCLIGIADRCRDKNRHLRKLTGDARDVAVPDHMRDQLLVCEINRIEVEQALKVLGVEPFNDHKCALNPMRQRIIRRITTTRKDQANSIAERIHPGYIRDGRVIRHELVNVYVPSDQQKKG